MAEDGDQGVKLPGLGLAMDHEPLLAKRYPHAISDSYMVLSKGVSLRERRMMEFIGNITDKPNWDRKVFDDTIVGKWKEEAKIVPFEDDDGDVYLTDFMFDSVSAKFSCMVQCTNSLVSALRSCVTRRLDSKKSALSTCLMPR